MFKKYDVLYVLEMDSVTNDNIIKVMDLCQDNFLLVGENNYSFYYDLTRETASKLIELGAVLEVIKSVELIDGEANENQKIVDYEITFDKVPVISKTIIKL